MPSSAAIAAACIGPAPPNGSRAKRRGSTPRSTVTTRSARTISWLATRTMPSAVSSSLEAERARRAPATAASAALGVELDAPGERRVGGEVAEQQVGVGDGRLGAAAPVAGRARDRRRPSAARPAARRPGRASRSSRRRRRRCGRRPSAAGSRARRSSASRCACTSPSSTTQTSHEVPPMSRPIALPSPPARAMRPAPTAPPAGPERTLQAPAVRRLRRAGDATRGLHHQRGAAGRASAAASESAPR